MLAEKLLPVLVIDEGFGSTRSGGGERSGQISSSEAGRQISTTYVLREESRIEAVPGADSILYGHRWRDYGKSHGHVVRSRRQPRASQPQRERLMQVFGRSEER